MRPSAHDSLRSCQLEKNEPDGKFETGYSVDITIADMQTKTFYTLFLLGLVNSVSTEDR